MLNKFISLKEYDGAFYSVVKVSSMYDEKNESSKELLEKIEKHLATDFATAEADIALDITNVGSSARNLLLYAANVKNAFPRTFFLPFNKEITDILGALDGDRNRLRVFDSAVLGNY